ncbi:MAG: F0F1 ATP synthase subunit epsilon [Planctomycetota bacterium]
MERFAVSGGFLKVGGPKITVLIDKAARPEEIDRSAVEQELTEVNAALQHPKSDEEFDTLRTKRSWCQARLALVG